MRRITIRLLGSFEVAIDGIPVTSFEYAKVRALLAYLAIEAQRPLPRTELATLLWPDQPERSARASLSQALTTLRNAFGDKNADLQVLLADVQAVQLNPYAEIEIDVVQFLTLLRTPASHTHRSWRTCASCSEQLRQALELYRGNFLADISIADSEVFEEWASLERGQLLQRALTTLERLVERAQWCGAYSEALAYAQRLVALEPFLEANQRTCIRLLALNGETTAALAQYRQLQSLLAQELASDPEEATKNLFHQIRRGELEALQPRSPAFTVPRPLAALVGRGDEHQMICTHLRNLNLRALTITGAGGIGKTRLALEVAHSLRYDFEDGVFFVELASVNDPGLVADAIARILGMKERLHQSIADTLQDYVRTKQMLLVLDNFEHVLAAAPLISSLLVAGPALTVLVTSRAPLAIRAEQQFILKPLGDTDAIQLFIERAQAVGAELTLDAASTALYGTICRRLDRLPLAIELIAVRARTLAPLELLQQLEQPLQALAQGLRDVSTRHQSLRQAIRWSYDLLDPVQQHVFRALGVFIGGWTTEAAQAVVGDSHTVLPVLEALNQSSLLQRHAVEHQTRFLFLETIREFALEQLEAHHEVEIAQQRHAGYYADFSMTAYLELLRPEAARWKVWIASEQDNLRLAFGWAIAHQQYETALRLATGIWRFHLMAGYLRAGLERLETALAYREHVPLIVQCNALRAAGALATALNDYSRARQWLEAAVETAWRVGDQSVLQPVLVNLGNALLEQGELEDARIHLEVSLSLARRADDPTVAKFPLGLLAGLHHRLGNYAEAQALSEEGLRLNQARRDPEGTADALRTLGSIMLAQGDLPRARQLGEEALALHGSLNHQFGMGLDYALFGNIEHTQANYSQALTQYQQCLTLWRERENMVNSAVVLESIAQTLSRIGEPLRAATLLGATAAIRERASVKLPTMEQAAYDTILLACRAALGTEACTAAQRAGSRLSLPEVIDLALQPLADL